MISALNFLFFLVFDFFYLFPLFLSTNSNMQISGTGFKDPKTDVTPKLDINIVY